MHRDRLWELLSRKISEEATKAELSELDELLRICPETELPAKAIQEFWNMPMNTDDAEFLEATFHLHTEMLSKQGIHLNNNLAETGSFKLESHSNFPKKKQLFFITAVSAFILSLVAGYVYFNAESKNPIIDKIAISEISTKKGSRTKVQLPDGTTVWLNSSSKLTYDNQNFGKQIREVSLSGEAYFDVVKNKTKPFIIHTAKMDMKVLGTVFNIKCYPDEKTTETSLIHGSVEVSLKDRQEKILMKPNEKLVLVNDDQKEGKRTVAANSQKSAVNVYKPIIELSHLTLYPTNNQIVETGWVENKLVFNNESLEEVISKMERWYSVTIIIQSEQLKQESLTGIFEKETIQQALKALQYTTKFNYKISSDTITILK